MIHFTTSSRGFRGLGCCGLAGLREELYARTAVASRDGVMESFDALVAQDDVRAEFVKSFQRAAKARGIYSKNIDGIWGNFSEAAWNAAAIRSRSRYTTMADVLAVTAFFSGGSVAAPISAVLAAGIHRDEWMRGLHQPESYTPALATADAPAPVVEPEEDDGWDQSGSFEPDDTMVAESTPADDVEDDDEAGTMAAAVPPLEAPPPDGGAAAPTIPPVRPSSSTAGWVIGGLAVLATVGMVWWVTQRRQPRGRVLYLGVGA